MNRGSQQQQPQQNHNSNHNETYRTARSNSTATVPAGNGQGEGSASFHSSISSVNHNISSNHNWMAVPPQVNIVHDIEEQEREARRSRTHVHANHNNRRSKSKNKNKNVKPSLTTAEEKDDEDDSSPYKITRKQAIETLLEDEELSDLQLRSMVDHQIVLAQRGWLASRSIVFRSLLYGRFKESKQSIVDLPYPSKVLRYIVEFIYSDDTSLFRTKPTSSMKKNSELIETIISVIDAANYFALPELVTKTEQYTKRLLEEDQSLVCLFLTACNNGGVASGGSEVDIVSNDDIDQQSTITAATTMSVSPYYSIPMAIIRSNPNLLLENNSSLESMTSTQLEFVLRDKQLNADEYILFQILYKWYQNNNGKNKENSDAEYSGENKRSYNPRLQDATKLSKLIKLEYINPMELSSIVATSGIISMEQLTDAYKHQAIRAQEHHHISYHKSRSAKPVWYSSNTTKVTCSAKPNPTSGDWSIELLQLSKPLMSSSSTSSSRRSTHNSRRKSKRKDIFKWKILVNKDCQDTWLGVAEVSSSSTTGMETAYSNINNNTTWLGGQSIGYIYGSSGWAWNNDSCMKRNLPTFAQGTTVTFILDLSTSTSGGDDDGNNDGTNNHNNSGDGNGNGTLRASIDDGVTMFDLFTNMLGSTTPSTTATANNGNNNPWARNDDEDTGGNNNAGDNNKAFVPAAFLRHPGEVTFLGFE